MKVAVTPECVHPRRNDELVPYTNHGEPVVGSHLIVSRDGAWVDGVAVVRRDRRAIKNREAGHPWIDPEGATWTGFRVDVMPNERGPR